MLPVKAEAVTYLAEMPPYDDKWTLTAGSNYPYADANLSTGRLEVFMYPFTAEYSSAHVKTWKRVWLPATVLEITYSWKLKGYLMCGLFFSFTGVDLYIFVEKSLNSGTINETTLFHKYVDLVWEYQETIDESPPPASIVVSIPEAGYYNVGAGLAGRAGGLLASCVFCAPPEDRGAWVSMKLTQRPPRLTISASSGGTACPAPGTYTYSYGSSVTVTASAYSYYIFNYWLLDGATVYGNPITVTMYSDHTLTACFYHSGGGGCPTLFVWDGTDYIEEGILDIHAESDVTVQYEIQNSLVLEKGVYKLQLRELDEFTSHIDQVKLYAVDYDGKWHLCPLTYAYHSELGKVKQALLLDDSNRVDLEPTETIDLRFAQSILYSQTAYFIFEINGYNRKPLPM
jgi:hypothetical protein